MDNKYDDYSKLTKEDLKRLANNIKDDMDNKKAEKKRKKFKLIK